MLLLLGVTKPFDLGFYIETLNTKKFLGRFLLESGKEKSKRERENSAALRVIKENKKHTDTHTGRRSRPSCCVFFLLLLCLLLLLLLVDDKREKILHTKI